MELDFLDEPQGSDETAVVETPAEAPVAEAAPEAPAQDAPPASDGPARGPDGKFVAKATETPPASAEPAPAEPAPAPAAPQGDDRVSQLEAQVAGLTKALTATRQQARQATPAPDHYVDPDAYRAWAEQQRIEVTADWSRRFAVNAHGEEMVTKAQEWAANRFSTDPVFQQQALNAQDPFGFAVDQYRRDQALQMLSDPTLLDRFQAFVSGQAPPQAAAPPGQHIPPRVEAPPASIVAAPNAGGRSNEPVGAGSAYDAALS